MMPVNARNSKILSVNKILIAWFITILVSALSDILWYELSGTIPAFLFITRIILPTALIVMSFYLESIRDLRPYFVILLFIVVLLKMYAWITGLPGFTEWRDHQSFAVRAITYQALETGAALILIGVLFLSRKHRSRFFLQRGDLDATAEPVKWWGQKSGGPIWQFGTVFTLVVIATQIFMFILPLNNSYGLLRDIFPLIPLILLLSASNGFNEEIMLRVAPISVAIEAVGKENAIWMAALLFGFSHYFGGIPSGMPGVLITTFLGWFFGKCLVESKDSSGHGFFIQSGISFPLHL